MTLIGETKGRPQGERVPINIAPEVRERLNVLLYEPEMRGVGYSEFIDRAIRHALAELNVVRSEQIVQ